MAFSAVASLLLCCLVPATAGSWKPVALPYDQLKDDKVSQPTLMDAMMKGLEEDGAVAITDIPGFADLRFEALKGAHACMSSSPLAQSSSFPDGTTRRTLAGVSAAGEQQRIDHGSSSPECQVWQEASTTFRKMVASAVDVFVKRLGSGLNIGALLQSRDGRSYDTLDEVARSGDRLEHFHSYNAGAKQGSEPTIDYHVDQGLFIAFVPAMLLDSDLSPRAAPQGFFIQTKGGVEHELDFDHFDHASLVILMGDGVNQYLNPQARLRLHAPRHAFQMPPVGPGLHRVWYGLMQLPPQDAFNPDKELTFGEIRAQVVADPGSSPSLGCSKQLVARELMASCGDNQIYCWHRCYDFTATASPDYCASQNSGFNCVNQFDQIYPGGHGDYVPACTNSTELETPRPPVEQPAGACSEFDELVADEYYAHRATLVDGETFFLWNVKGDQLEGQMIHRGAVGWMAIGIENIGGFHNGMNGGRVVQGLNDPSTYPTVAERKIHDSASAFRHWKTPLANSALSNASMVIGGCYTTMQFTTSTIYETPLNTTEGSSNHLIWALSQLAYPTSDFGGYAPYHADPVGNSSQRERFRGKVVLTMPDPKETDPKEMSLAVGMYASNLLFFAFMALRGFFW